MAEISVIVRLEGRFGHVECKLPRPWGHRNLELTYEPGRKAFSATHPEDGQALAFFSGTEDIGIYSYVKDLAALRHELLDDLGILIEYSNPEDFDDAARAMVREAEALDE